MHEQWKKNDAQKEVRQSQALLPLAAVHHSRGNHSKASSLKSVSAMEGETQSGEVGKARFGEPPQPLQQQQNRNKGAELLVACTHSFSNCELCAQGAVVPFE
jgi:hypothetical protein